MVTFGWQVAGFFLILTGVAAALTAFMWWLRTQVILTADESAAVLVGALIASRPLVRIVFGRPDRHNIRG